MFRGLFKGHDKDDDYFEPVDPVVEQRRKEKFSTPLIYEEDFESEKPKPKKVEKQASKPKVEKEVKKERKEKPETVEVETPPKSGYQSMQVISPMRGVTSTKSKPVTKKPVMKIKKRKLDNQLIPVISPFFGDMGAEEEVEQEAVLQSVEETVEDTAPKTIEEVPTVEENLRNIAKIVEEEKDQLKIIEERTGEFKLDFTPSKEVETTSLIDEIDDDMSLDELMSLYEKKFTD